MSNQQKTIWDKAKVKFIKANITTMSRKDMAAHFGVRQNTLNANISRLRNKGKKLPKVSPQGNKLHEIGEQWERTRRGCLWLAEKTSEGIKFVRRLDAPKTTGRPLGSPNKKPAAKPSKPVKKEVTGFKIPDTTNLVALRVDHKTVKLVKKQEVFVNRLGASI